MSSKPDLLELANEIVLGKRLSKNDDLRFFIDCDLDALTRGADYIRRRLIGNRVDLCSVVNARSGRCSENCKYCAQSVYSSAKCEVYPLLSQDKLIAACKINEMEGVDRFSLVTSGRALCGKEFERAVLAFQALRKECDVKLCASMGFLTTNQLRRLRESGVTTYHHNIETSPSYFSKICTTHSIEDKLATFERVKAAGLRLCSGGIVGLGESWEDRIEMAATLAEHEVDSIPINELIPIRGTALENLPRLTEPEILRIIAIFRYLNPTSSIRLAAGRTLMSRDGERAFESGADATITGNMLTTVACATIRSDRAMLRALGREIKEAPGDAQP